MHRFYHNLTEIILIGGEMLSLWLVIVYQELKIIHHPNLFLCLLFPLDTGKLDLKMEYQYQMVFLLRQLQHHTFQNVLIQKMASFLK